MIILIYIVIHSFDETKLKKARTLLMNYYYDKLTEYSSKSMLISNKILIDFCISDFKKMENQRCDIVYALDTMSREKLISFIIRNKDVNLIKKTLDNNFDAILLNRHLVFGSLFIENIVDNISNLISIINENLKYKESLLCNDSDIISKLHFL